MNQQELRDKLELVGVHPSLYSLGSPAQGSESYSLVKDGSSWKVLYKERGQFSEIQASLSESEACQLIYQLLESALGLGHRIEA